MKYKNWLIPPLLITISLLITSCGDEKNSSNDSYPPPNPTEKEEQRRRQVELECAMHPERCEDVDHLYIDDSNLPDDPCRDFGDCNGGYSGVDGNPSGGQSQEQDLGCPYGCKDRKPGCDIKGNISYKTGEYIYHVPGQEFYNVTGINPERGERWFCAEQEAIANGWRKSMK